jgi:hypothetical protein
MGSILAVAHASTSLVSLKHDCGEILAALLPDDEGSQRIDRAVVGIADEDRRGDLLDHGRAADAVAEMHLVAVVDRGFAEALGLGDVHAALAFQGTG